MARIFVVLRQKENRNVLYCRHICRNIYTVHSLRNCNVHNMCASLSHSSSSSSVLLGDAIGVSGFITRCYSLCSASCHPCFQRGMQSTRQTGLLVMPPVNVTTSVHVCLFRGVQNIFTRKYSNRRSAAVRGKASNVLLYRHTAGSIYPVKLMDPVEQEIWCMMDTAQRVDGPVLSKFA